MYRLELFMQVERDLATQTKSAWIKAIIPVFALFWYYFYRSPDSSRGSPCLGRLGLDLSDLVGGRQSGRAEDSSKTTKSNGQKKELKKVKNNKKTRAKRERLDKRL
jgi:hypothetical protein